MSGWGTLTQCNAISKEELLPSSSRWTADLLAQIAPQHHCSLLFYSHLGSTLIFLQTLKNFGKTELDRNRNDSLSSKLLIFPREASSVQERENPGWRSLLSTWFRFLFWRSAVRQAWAPSTALMGNSGGSTFSPPASVCRRERGKVLCQLPSCVGLENFLINTILFP